MGGDVLDLSNELLLQYMMSVMSLKHGRFGNDVDRESRGVYREKEDRSVCTPYVMGF